MRLPEDSLTRTTAQSRQRMAELREWSLDTELLAQIVEEISILAADRRRPQPRTIDRPGHVSGGAGAGVSSALRTLQATARVRSAA